MEAGLLELLLDVDPAGLFERQQPGAHPADLLPAHVLLGDVDRGPGQMRAGDVALGRGCVAVDPLQLLLVGDGPHRRAYLEGTVKLRRMGARQIREKGRRPGPAIAPVPGQVAVHRERRRHRHRHQHSAGDAIVQIVVVLDAFKTVGFSLFVLPHQRLKGSAQRRQLVDPGYAQRNSVDISGTDCRGGCSGLAEFREYGVIRDFARAEVLPGRSSMRTCPPGVLA